MTLIFNHEVAFSRNLGWITPEEVQLLKQKRIAIAGMGGVGGVHLITLIRMGFTKFSLADFDVFELHNFNRQYGANMKTLGHSKLSVMIELAKNINPDIEIRAFPEGVNDKNLNAFLQDVDLYVDGLDFFALETRINVFQKCEDLKIPVTTVAPIGMGGALLNFIPGQGLDFKRYFGLWPGIDKKQGILRFLVGLSPKMPHLKSLVDRSYSNLLQEKTASTPMGCQFSSGIVATEAVKILLNRGPVISAPKAMHFDAYSYQLKKSTFWGGYANPLYKLLVWLAFKMQQTSSK